MSLTYEEHLKNVVYKYHPPCPPAVAKHEVIRELALQFALRLCELCPNTRERTVAQTKLEEVVSWANAAIARNECSLFEQEGE